MHPFPRPLLTVAQAAGGGGGNPYGLVGAGAISASSLNGGTISVPLPTGIAVNDIIVIQWEYLSATATPGDGSATGYTAKTATNVGPATAYRHGILWKRATSAETGNVDVSFPATGSFSSTARAVISAWGGCATTGDPLVSAATNTGQTASAISGSVTTSAANQIVANYVATDDDTSTMTPPSGFTEAYDYNDIVGFDGSLGLNYKEIAAAGAVGAQTTALATSERWSVISFGLLRA